MAAEGLDLRVLAGELGAEAGDAPARVSEGVEGDDARLGLELLLGERVIARDDLGQLRLALDQLDLELLVRGVELLDATASSAQVTHRPHARLSFDARRLDALVLLDQGRLLGLELGHVGVQGGDGRRGLVRELGERGRDRIDALGREGLTGRDGRGDEQIVLQDELVMLGLDAQGLLERSGSVSVARVTRARTP